MSRAIHAAMLVSLPFTPGAAQPGGPSPRLLDYEIALDETAPRTAEVRLADPLRALLVARAGDESAIAKIACGTRRLAIVHGRVAVPQGCRVLTWRIALADGARGMEQACRPAPGLPSAVSGSSPNGTGSCVWAVRGGCGS